MAFVSLALVLLGSLVAMLAVTIFMMARMLLRPPLMNDARAAYVLKRLSPTDLGLKYETLSFVVRDEASGKKLRLAAWWIAAPAPDIDKTVVLIHGYGDAKVGAIAWAPLWHSLGYHILATDLRAHGESDGVYSTAGYFERHDLNQLLNQLRAQRPGETRQLVVFGISLGAAVALAALAIRESDDIDGLVCECPYADYASAAMTHASFMNLPFRSLQPISIRVAQSLSGARFDEVRPVDLIPKIRCPLMIIQSCDDPLVPSADIAAIQRAVSQSRNQMYWPIAGTMHVMGICADPEMYRERIVSFLQEASLGAQQELKR